MHEPRLADRARDRDRLLVARSSTASARNYGTGGPRRRDRDDDGHGRPRGGVLRHRGRDRPGVAPVHAAAVHARLRRRRADHPDRLGRRGAHVPAGAPVAPRATARACAAAAEAGAGPPRRPRARVLGERSPTAIMRRPVAGRNRDDRVPAAPRRCPCSPSSSARARTRAFRRASSRSRASTSSPRPSVRAPPRRPRSWSTPARPGGVADPAVEAALGRCRAGSRPTRRSRGSSSSREPAIRRPDAAATSTSQVIGKSDYGKPESLDFVDRLRGEIVPAARLSRRRRASSPAAAHRAARTSST